LLLDLGFRILGLAVSRLSSAAPFIRLPFQCEFSSPTNANLVDAALS
jgi:hypothetical protein